MKQLTPFVPWLAAAAILVVIFGAIYGVVQQAERTGANFPQIQIAEDLAAALNQGAKPANITAGHVDMAASLAPFVIIYDQAGKLVGGSGYLGGQVPLVPIGVLRAAGGQDYHAVTWEPEPTVRIAVVAVAATKYYVVSGRSLREVEKNEDLTLRHTIIAGLASWLILAAAFVYMRHSVVCRSK